MTKKRNLEDWYFAYYEANGPVLCVHNHGVDVENYVFPGFVFDNWFSLVLNKSLQDRETLTDETLVVSISLTVFKLVTTKVWRPFVQTPGCRAEDFSVRNTQLTY